MVDDLKLWLPLYASDILTSRKMRRWDAERIGIFMLLICEQWVGGPLPNDRADLCDMARAEWPKVQAILQAQFVLTDKGWINERLVDIWYEQMAKIHQKSRAGKIGAEARWGKKFEVQPGDLDATADATALPPDTDRNASADATAIGCYKVRNSNESRGEEKRVEEITTLEGGSSKTSEADGGSSEITSPKRHAPEPDMILIRNGLLWGTIQHPKKRGYKKITREYFEDLMWATKDRRPFPENLVIETQQELDAFLEA